MIKKVGKTLANNTHDLVFKTVHNHCLIYNMCWEDPRIDRQILGLGPDSKVVVLTSAGCNTLDYLLDAPAEIHAVDVNPRQNALLHLKLALIEHGDFDDLFAMFGRGSHRAFRRVYGGLRRHLPLYAQAFWDDKIRYFDDASKRRSFYYYGTSGAVAWLVSRYLIKLKKPLARLLFELLDARTLTEQQALYERIEPQLWTRLVAWLLKQPLTLSMLGVPRPQMRLIDARYPGGIVGYVADKLKHVFTEVLIRDNYFWRAYLTGSYTDVCCPNYLKPENFDLLRARAHRVLAHNCTVSEFLEHHPGAYSHFILLDHQDWLAWHKPAALHEEWRLLLANSKPGAKVLMRSASHDVGFLPDWVQASLAFFPDLTGALHRQDRVGTYGSLHLAQVR